MPPEPISPKPLLEKLGVRLGARVSVLGVRDADFLRLLAARADVAVRPRRDSDLVFLQADTPKPFARLATLRATLRPAGAIWVVTPKRTPGVRDVDVIAAAKAAGLVDNKVVAFSPTHTALRLVIPVKDRPT